MSKKIDIVSLYLSNYKSKYNGREIARLSSINHQTALNHLNDLIKTKIMIFNNNGKNKDYHLDLSNLKTNLLIEMAECYRSICSFDNKELSVIIKEILPFTDSLILFGSFASGSYNKDSDIDIICVGKSDKSAINKIKRRYSREINLEFVSYNEFKKSLDSKNALSVEILKNHIFYGDVSRLVSILINWYTR
ncbi:MAG: nucleotidyltransferase domain-containing protein [Nanoarchaeota archaeon]